MYTEAIDRVANGYDFEKITGPIIGCAMFIFLVGIFTTSSTIVKAAKTNPVETLRSE